MKYLITKINILLNKIIYKNLLNLYFLLFFKIILYFYHKNFKNFYNIILSIIILI